MAREWTTNLAVGIKSIDDQHKALFASTNELLTAMASGAAETQLPQLLEFLAKYVVGHFGLEEQYMDRFAYPGAMAHKNQHQAFLREFGAIKAQFDAKGASPVLILQVHKRVCDWLVNLISRTDRLLGDFLKPRMAA